MPSLGIRFSVLGFHCLQPPAPLFYGAMHLSATQLRRYSRHLLLPEIGEAGQVKLCGTSVLCVGAGGLGSPIALYLAAAGIGKLGIVDFDAVDFSNLQRQVLHGTPDVGRAKTQSARDAIRRLNPDVEVCLHETRLTSQNALEVIRPYDIVVDGTDNFPTRYLTNDACVLLRKPNVYGSIFRFEGQASVFAPHLGAPCYRCLYPEPPPPGLVPSCAEGGVLGVLPGIIGLIQATEILKLAAGVGTPLLNRLLLFNALDMNFRELKLRRDPQCPLCGEHPTITKLIDYENFCGLNTQPQTAALHADEVTVQDMKKALDNPKLGIRVIDVREPNEYRIARVEGVPLLPMSQLQQRYTELDPDQTYYLHCKAGARSLHAVQFLRQQGFKHVKSVMGGIGAWSREIDPSVPQY
jgi:molybdopterin/thiamine biosynthesis adenylyltransferase/rhodanese-related sulfurtransferase